MLTALALPDVLDPRVLGALAPDPRWLGGLLLLGGIALLLSWLVVEGRHLRQQVDAERAAIRQQRELTRPSGATESVIAGAPAPPLAPA